MNKFNRHITTAIVFLLGLTFSNVLTILAHGGDTALIHACVKNSNGTIRIIGASDTCSNNETPLDWRIQGEPGPAGTSGEQLVKDFVVAPGENISAGDVVSFIDNGQVIKGTGFGQEVFFNDAAVFNASAAALSPTQFVVAYFDGGNSNFGTAIIGTVSENTITFGPEAVFNAAGPGYFTTSASVVALSSDQFVIAYPDGGNSNFGTAIIGTVSENTITFGPEAVVNEAFTSYIAAAALSPTQFVVTRIGAAVVGTVSGNIITFGPEAVFNNAASIAALSPTQFVLAYGDSSNFGFGTAIIGTVSGNTITFGSEYVFNATMLGFVSAAALSNSQFVVAYAEGGESDVTLSAAIIGTVSGTAINFGQASIFYSNVNPAITGQYMSAIALSPTDFVVAYANGALSPFDSVVNGMTSGDTIMLGAPVLFNVRIGSLSAIMLSPTRLVFVYRDGLSLFGGAVVSSSSIGTLIGTAKSSAVGGDTLPVIIGGISDVHSGLTPGTIYYAQPDGTLATSFSPNLIGLAVSPTDILLKLGK